MYNANVSGMFTFLILLNAFKCKLYDLYKTVQMYQYILLDNSLYNLYKSIFITE